MKKAKRILGKSLMFIIIGILSLVLLTVLGLNIAKHFIYSEYYSIKTNICKNPGLNDGFVCQGIAVSEENEVILVCGYMKDKSNSRIYVTDFESNSYYVELTRDGEKYTGHAGGLAITGDTVYIANAKKIYSFPLESVLSANNGDIVDIGSGTKVNTNASFVYTDEDFSSSGSVVIVTYGRMFKQALLARDELSLKGIKSSVLVLEKLTPFGDAVKILK